MNDFADLPHTWNILVVNIGGKDEIFLVQIVFSKFMAKAMSYNLVFVLSFTTYRSEKKNNGILNKNDQIKF